MPVDFEEVHVSSNADEEDIRNAIMAIRRNRVALKGELRGQVGVLYTIPFAYILTFVGPHGSNFRDFLILDDSCSWHLGRGFCGPVDSMALLTQYPV